MEDDVTDRTDGLYALPLERFVAERDALAKSLSAEGRRADAAEVAALPKPSVAAWAVNQVVRSQGQAARTLWDAGDAVLAVQERIMDGSASGADLRDAVERERRALAPLADAARGLVTGGGRFLGEQNVQAVTETLHAAAVDPEARGPVAAGRAVRPLQLSGLGAAPAAAAPRRSPSGSTPSPSPAERRQAGRRSAEDPVAAERRQAERERSTRRKEAQRALARAEQDREQARERVGDAVRAREAATARLEAAMRELSGAEDELGRAEQALAQGHEALERAEGAVEAAHDAVQQA